MVLTFTTVILCVIQRRNEEKTVALRAASDKFFEVCRALRAQHPGWSLFETLC